MPLATTRRAWSAVALLAALLYPSAAPAQVPFGSAFTYQGRLTDVGGPANGTYDIRFTLFTASSGGVQVGQVVVSGLAVTGGLFTATLDFGGAAFDGTDRWLELAVQQGGGGFQVLSPRQHLTPAPYAQTMFTRTVVVKPVGTVAQNGNALLTALNGITTATQTNPWLLKIEPGIYQVPPGALHMKPYVDMEGSGENVTLIRSVGTPDNATGTLLTADNVELRSLTVENTGGDQFAKPIYVHGTSPVLSHVTASSSGATIENHGIFVDEAAGGTNAPLVKDSTILVIGSGAANGYGFLSIGNVAPNLYRVSSTVEFGGFATAFWNYQTTLYSVDIVGITCCATSGSEGMSSVQSSVQVLNSQFQGGFPGSGMSAVAGSTITLRNVSVNGGDNGILNDSSYLDIRRSGVGGTTGINNTATTGTFSVRIDDSAVSGTTRTINSTAQFSIFVGASKLDGPVPAGGTQACVASYTGAYLPLTAGCN
jgi:hypothetical protein